MNTNNHVSCHHLNIQQVSFSDNEKTLTKTFKTWLKLLNPHIPWSSFTPCIGSARAFYYFTVTRLLSYLSIHVIFLLRVFNFYDHNDAWGFGIPMICNCTLNNFIFWASVKLTEGIKKKKKEKKQEIMHL